MFSLTRNQHHHQQQQPNFSKMNRASLIREPYMSVMHKYLYLPSSFLSRLISPVYTMSGRSHEWSSSGRDSTGATGVQWHQQLT
jgi:hypothetical protein